MLKFDEIPRASVECNETLEDEGSRKIALARRLEAAGHRTIAVGRAIVTIERCESASECPPEVSGDWGILKLSFYGDPDVSGDEKPTCFFLEGSRFGFSRGVMQLLNDSGRERIFELNDRLLRDDF